MDLQHILDDLRALKEAIENGDWMEVWRLEIELQTHGFEIAKLFVKSKSKRKKMMGDQSDIRNKIESEAQEVMAKAAEQRATLALEPMTMKAGDTKGAIGDGKILDILLMILPYILKLIA